MRGASDAPLLAAIRAHGFAKPSAAALSAPRSFSGRVPDGELRNVPLVVRRSFDEFDRLRAVRHRVLCAVAKSTPTTTSSASSTSNNNVAALKPTNTATTNRVVVGVGEAAKRAALRAIGRGEFALKPAADKTRVTHRVVVGVDDAVKRLALRSIRLGQFTLRHVDAPRVRTQCVVGGQSPSLAGASHSPDAHARAPTVKEAATRLALRSIRRGEYALKHVETRVRKQCVVGGRARVGACVTNN